MFSVNQEHPANAEVSQDLSSANLQSSPAANPTNRALDVEESERTSAAPPTSEEIRNLSTMYGEPTISSGNAPADVQGQTPGFRKTETEALRQLDANGKLDEETQAKLLSKLSKGQSNDRGRKIAEQTEQEYTRLTEGMPESDKKLVKQSLKDYASDSTSINNVLRGKDTESDAGTAGRKAAADRTVSAVNKLQQAQGDVSRVTYRLQSYKGDDKAKMPFGSDIKPGDTIQNQGIWSTSQNRSFVKPDSQNTDNNNHNVKFVIAGKGGANVADPEGPYSNQKQQDLFNLENKGKMSRIFKKPEPGQAEVLYSPNTNFKVNTIQNTSANETHVLLTVADGDESGKPVKDAYSGEVINGRSCKEA